MVSPRFAYFKNLTFFLLHGVFKQNTAFINLFNKYYWDLTIVFVISKSGSLFSFIFTEMLHLPLDDTFFFSFSVYVFKGKFFSNFNFSHPLSYLKYWLFMMKVDLYQTVYHVQQYSTERSKIFHTDMRLPGRVNHKVTSLLESTENRLKAPREPPNQPWKSTSEFVRAISNPNRYNVLSEKLTLKPLKILKVNKQEMQY